MKRLLFGHAVTAALILSLSLPVFAQGDQEDLKKKLEEKLAEDWLKNGDWTTDYDKALKRAKESEKPIFAYFTRSYSY
jgi:hypothetical protein